MLGLVTWFWGSKYPPDDVRKLADGVRRHLKQDHKFFVVTDGPGEFEDDETFYRVAIDEADRDLLITNGCFSRLRMFSLEWQAKQQFRGIERFVCIDLDVVITGPLDPLFNRPDTFVILQGANAANPCPFNGSLMMLRAGAQPEVWSDFNLETELAWKTTPGMEKRYYEFADDQGYLWHKLPNAAGWECGPRSGVYAFQKPQWPKGEDLPSDARMVVFPGWRSPEKFKHLPWVEENWI